MFSLSIEERNAFNRLLEIALEEDLGNQGDITSKAIFSQEKGKYKLVSKDTGILAGAECFQGVFHRIDPNLEVNFVIPEGTDLIPGKVVAHISGSIQNILVGERTALNFLAFLSGIATATNQMVQAAGERGKAVILDTRKTLPGFRLLSKYAVRVGGGMNHRIGLYDMILIKDNHIDATGSITQAVKKVRDRWGKQFLIEVECRSLEEVAEAVKAGVDRILLDNMDEVTTRKAVTQVGGRIPLESSGDMTLERVRQYASTGVDFISVGRLTHSVQSFNFSLQMEGDIS
jgi:nicotinate-nucleotide pyrophosphorylase (carboxylating)